MIGSFRSQSYYQGVQKANAFCTPKEFYDLPVLLGLRPLGARTKATFLASSSRTERTRIELATLGFGILRSTN